MKFLIDANLSPALARWLVSEGHDASHLNDLGLAATFDREIWQRARDIDACIVTKDEDFVRCRRWIERGLPSSGSELVTLSAVCCCIACRHCGQR